MTQHVYISAEELKRLVSIVEALPETDQNVKITCEASSGVGSNIWVTKHISVNNIHGEFSVQVSDPKDW